MNIKGLVLVVAGVSGAVLVCIWDIILGKPVNDITGPKSIAALVFCGVLIISGIRLSLKKKAK